MASGLVFVSGSSSLWFFQQTPLTAWPAPDNYVLRYVGFRMKVGSSPARQMSGCSFVGTPLGEDL